MWVFSKEIKRGIKKKPTYLELAVIRIGRPTAVGNIYTERSISDILEIFHEEKGRKVYGTVIGDSEITVKSRNIRDCTHCVEELYIEDGFLVAVARFLDSDAGRKARRILKEGMGMLRPTIHGYADQSTKEIMVTDVISFDILPFNSTTIDLTEWIRIK